MIKKLLLILTVLTHLVLSANADEKPLDLNFRGFAQSQPITSIKSSIEAQRILVTIRTVSDLYIDWAHRRCDDAKAMFERISSEPLQIDCEYKSSQQYDLKRVTVELGPKYNSRFLLDIEKTFEGGLRLTLADLMQKDPEVKAVVGWVLEGDSLKDELDTKFAGAIFVFNKMKWVKEALIDLAWEAENPKKTALEVEKITSGQKYLSLKLNSRYSRETAQFLTSGTQLIAALGVGWYGYHFLTENKPDFDNANFKAGLINKLKFGSLFRYDDNSFKTNINHSFAGMSYYVMCRGNGLSALNSYLCATAGSLAWELLIEWREVWSINDQIFTGHGGSILGEAIYQTGRYLFAKGPRFLKNTLGFAWSGPADLSNWISKRGFGVERADTRDNNLAGKFEIEFGYQKSSQSIQQKFVSLESDVIRIPLYDEPGESAEFLTDLVESEFKISAAASSEILSQMTLFAKVVFAAYSVRKLKKDSLDRLNGYQFFVGPSAALEINNNNAFYDDFYGIVHVIGGTFKIENYYHGMKITSSFDLWGDSVMMHSLAIEDYISRNGSPGLVNNLSSGKYYHGWGATSRGQVIVELPSGWSFGAEISGTKAVNTNTRGRGEVTTYPNLTDRIADSSVWLKIPITKDLDVRFLAGYRFRSGSSQDVTGSNSVSIKRTQVALNYHF